MARGFDKQLYILPFDHRGSFKMFGWQGALNAEQTAEIAAAPAKWAADIATSPPPSKRRAPLERRPPRKSPPTL
jgi:hypothetical protein